jgi:hypothetical protein
MAELACAAEITETWGIPAASARAAAAAVTPTLQIFF